MPDPGAEIILGVVCPLGTPYEPIVQRITTWMRQVGYQTSDIRISAQFAAILRGDDHAEGRDFSNFDAKIWAGDRIRTKTNNAAALAYFAARSINQARLRREGGVRGMCHLVIQLKRPEEVELLRNIYGPGFFLIGLSPTMTERMLFFTERGLSEKEAKQWIEMDQEEKNDGEVGFLGQQTRKTYHLADVFVPTSEPLQLDRFLELMFSNPFLTPTRDERGMFMAFASSFSSGDLSRQVGAALTTASGDLVALGYNEVPRAHGGTYHGEDAPDCHRDIEKGSDANHQERERIAHVIAETLGSSQQLAKSAFGKSGLYDITEFGRAVHAELDAILCCARNGQRTAGTILYVTTFPCHNCTRHIIAAGIERVVFVEPYPRSKAAVLHGDAIRLEDDATSNIPFVPFLGVGPRRYVDLFALRLGSGRVVEREKDGFKEEWIRALAHPRLAMHPTSYLEREGIAAAKIGNLRTLLLDAPRQA